MKKLVFILPFLLLIEIVFAQTPKNLPVNDSGSIIREGITAYDKGSYHEAESLYKQVVFGDSLYYSAQYELALTYVAQERYQEALLLLSQIPDDDASMDSKSVWLLKGNTYSFLNDLPKALETFEQAIAQFPYFYQLYYNRGVVYTKMEDYKHSADNSKQALFCYPLHQTSHYQLGISYLKQRCFIPAILALNYAVIVNPNSNNALLALQTLDALFTEGLDKYTTADEEDIPQEVKDWNARFKPLEAMVRSNIVQKKNFKSKTDINHIISKQIQLIFENIEADPNFNSNSIENLLYIPTFTLMMQKKNYFNYYNYYIFQGTDLDNFRVREKAQKMEKELNSLINDILKQLSDALVKGIEQPKTGKSYFYNQYVINEIGAVDAQNREDGEWTLINNGHIGKIMHYQQGKANGIATEYDELGNIQYRYQYENGKISGKVEEFFPQSDNEHLQLETTYSLKNRMREGDLERYNYAKALAEKSVWKNNLYNGSVQQYYPQGTLKLEAIYENGIPSEKMTQYYENGAIKNHTVMNDDKTRTTTGYFTNGKQSYILMEKDTLVIGKTLNFYATGEKSAEIFFNDQGKQEGLAQYYYKSGQLKSQMQFVNGNADGEQIYWAPSGQKTISIFYKDGEIQEVITYLPDGTMRKSVKPAHGLIQYDAYFMDGDLSFRTATVSSNTKGETQGVQTYYSPQGNIISKYNCVKNVQDGTSYRYFPTGNLKQYSHLQQGAYNGLYMTYFENDSIESEGYFKNGTQVGTWYGYTPDGSLSYMQLFDYKGNMKLMTFYYGDGKVLSKTTFKNGMMVQYDQYDDSGNLLGSSIFENGNGEKKRYYFNGNLSSKVEIKAGKEKGSASFFEINGQLKQEIPYTEGVRNGDIETSMTGKLSKMHVDVGLLNGPYISSVNGVKVGASHYAENSKEGAANYYYEVNGNLQFSGNYEENEKSGIWTTYAPDGKTILYEIKYYQNVPYAYSTMGTDNKMSKFTFIENGTCKFTAYYPNSKMSGYTIINNGDIVKEMYYYPDGKVAESYNKQNAILMDTLFYPNGSIFKISPSYCHFDHGTVLYYYPDNKPKIQISYFFDDLNGEVLFYDKQGIVTRKEIWYYDNQKQ